MRFLKQFYDDFIRPTPYLVLGTLWCMFAASFVFIAIIGLVYVFNCIL
jgi:hypothetical protein